MAAKGVDPACGDLAAHFLGESYKAWAPSEAEAAADLRSLSEAIQDAVEGWFLGREP